MKELSVLKQAVKDFMMTLEPYQVPIIVQSLPDKATLEALVQMDLFSVSTCFFQFILKINVSSGNAIALRKKRCGMDQKKLIM